MAPFLINKRQVFTFVVLFLFLALICFVCGFFLGYQYATNKTSSSTISKLFLPDAESSVMIAEDYSAPAKEPGEDVDVDKPDVVSPDVKEADIEPSDIVVPLKVTTKNVENKTVIATKEINSEEIVSEPIEVDTHLNKIIDNATKENARYSIQVGLYGIKINAERRVQDLINKQLSGHLTSFINNKGDTLYNVRFGYFLDKASVDEALEIYQQKYTGEGYIVGPKK